MSPTEMSPEFTPVEVRLAEVIASVLRILSAAVFAGAICWSFVG